MSAFAVDDPVQALKMALRIKKLNNKVDSCLIKRPVFAISNLNDTYTTQAARVFGAEGRQ